MIKNKGFTLVEIMVVVAVIGVLASIVSPQIGSMLSKAKITATQAETQNVGLAVASYRADYGYYPGRDIGYGYKYSYYYGNAENLNAFLMAPGKFYLSKKISMDPWGRGYYYHMYLLSNPYVDVVFYSAGPDAVNSSWSGSVWLTGAFAGDDIGIMIDG